MLFNSPIFLFAFLPFVVGVYYLLGRTKNSRSPIIFLVCSSIFFYAWWSPPLVLLLAFSVAANFFTGLAIHSFRGAGKAKGVFVSGVLGNLSLLGYFKYAGFLTHVVNDFTDIGFPVPEIILPLAISFFTFQQIAYLADVYAGQSPERDFVKYSLFVTFFPQLIARPIVHHKEMMPQYGIHTARHMDMTLINLGVTVFAIGLFKKILLADTAAINASRLFDGAATASSISFFEAWFGSLAYSFQIYFDFSGYSDMAIGLGLMFGIRLPLNFLSPYKATSIIDFWQRWHMTLSRFLRDYLYIPLGGNRRGKSRRYTNLMLTMLLGGLWHGAGWTFIIWGGLHGIYLVINYLWRWIAPQSIGVWYARGITFIAVVVAWVFFRADDMATSLKILHAMSGLGDISLPLIVRPYFGEYATTLESWGVAFAGMSPNGLLVDPVSMLASLTLMAIIIWCAPPVSHLLRHRDQTGEWLPLIAHQERAFTIKWSDSISRGILIGMIFAFCFLALSRESEFIYFNF